MLWMLFGFLLPPVALVCCFTWRDSHPERVRPMLDGMLVMGLVLVAGAIVSLLRLSDLWAAGLTVTF